MIIFEEHESAGVTTDGGEGHMRIRIVELLLVVAVFAFATVSLTHADELFEMLFFNFTLFVILISLVMAIGRANGARAFWSGFFGTSCLYLGFSLVPDTSGAYSPRYDGPEFTTKLLRFAGEQLHPSAFESDTPSTGGFFSVQETPDLSLTDFVEAADFEDVEVNLSLELGSGQIVVPQNFPLKDPFGFMRIGHAAWALLFGWIAGHFSRLVYERSRRGVS